MTATSTSDSLGRLRHQVALLDVDDDNTWQITTYYYDELGNRTYEYSPDGVWTEYTYNALGQLTKKVADSSGAGKIEQTTEYAYDRLGRQTSIIGYADPNTAQTTQYKYDDLDRITKITYPDTNEITYQYNEAGRVTRRNDQQGIVTTYSYDGVYNMTAKYVDGNSVTDNANEIFTYDGLGRILTATKNINDVQISLDEFTYNGIGKVTATDANLFGITKTINYTYDQAGYKTGTTCPYSYYLNVNITPDWQGRIDTLKVNGTDRVTYKYIGSRVAQRKYLTFIGTLVQVSYDPTYDNLGRITSAPTIETYGTTSTITEFDYEYDPNTNDITKMIYDHRTSDPCTDFTYDDLSRLTQVDYGIEDNNEIFTIDDLGNRDNVNIRDGNDVDYSIDNLTNRYNSVGGNTLTYDAAGNLIKDHNGYEYKYDYENRITKITKSGPTTVAEFAYDALGRRIKKRDSIADTNNIYFYNPDWQVICDYNDAGVFQRWFAYGNYIDEVLITSDSTGLAYYRWYVHDHLYSPVALVGFISNVLERYEYDAYGNCYILEPNFAPDPDGKSDYGNPYLFTGRRVDILDANSLKIQYNRNRYYDHYTGRWLTHDPLGITPNDRLLGLFAPLVQYVGATNLLLYADGNPVNTLDAYGLLTSIGDPRALPALIMWLESQGLTIAEIIAKLHAAGWPKHVIIAVMVGMGITVPGHVAEPMPIDVAPPITYPISRWRCPPPSHKRYKCCDTTYMFLRSMVEIACKGGVEMRCRAKDEVPDLYIKMGRHVACLGARLTMMYVCFTPSDPEWKNHADQAASHAKGIAKCAGYIAAKEKYKFRL